MLDACKLSECLLKTYDAAYGKDRWRDAMEACRRTTEAAHTYFYVVGGDSLITWNANGGSPSLAPFTAEFLEYNRRFARPDNTGYDDVGISYMHQAPCGAPVLDTDIWPLDWLENRDELKFNKEALGIFRKFYINTSNDPLVKSGIHFWYHSRFAEIPALDLKMGACVGPHLTKAFDIARWAEALRRKYRAVLSVLDRIEIGVCLVDTRGRTVLANRHAKQIFDAKDGVWQDLSGGLVTADSVLSAAVEDAVQNVARTAQGEGVASEREFSVPRRGSPNPLLLMVSPLRDADMELERSLQGCLVTIIDTDIVADFRLDAFGDAYGFTPKERKAAKLLASGLSTPEIGEELGVAVSTAQTHVKSILQKTLSKNRVSFVWKAVQFSPPVV